MSQKFTATENQDYQSALYTQNTPQRRKRPSPSLLHHLRIAMLAVGGAILLSGLLLLVLPMLHVSDIQVIGASFYTDEEVIAASGIEVGDEVMQINYDDVCQSIWKELPYVNSIRIRRAFNTVKITVEENTGLMYTEFVGKYYVINRDFRVLAAVEDESTLSGILRVELPEIARLAVGSQIRFENEALDTGYILELLDSLESRRVLSRVTSVDAAKKYNVSYVMDGCCRVELGKVGDMTLKLTLVDEILARKGSAAGEQAVVNVSDLSKPTYRAIDTLI